MKFMTRMVAAEIERTQEESAEDKVICGDGLERMV